MALSPLRALLNILTQNVEHLEAAYAKAGQSLPSIDEPFEPTPLDFDPSLEETRSLIVAAVDQMKATFFSPINTLENEIGGLFMTAALGLIEEANIVDILVDAGDQGMHVTDIAVLSNVDPAYLGRILRYLATRHIFKEVCPNVFKNNRLSSLLKKSKTVTQLKANPGSRWDDSPIASFIATIADESLKSVAYLSPVVQRKVDAATPFNVAFKTSKPLFEWYDEPGNEQRNRRCTAIMRAIASQHRSETFTSAVREFNLKSGDVVVDVGGSVGSATLVLFNEFPDLKYVVQDLEKPIAEAHGYWEQNNAEAIKSGRVKLQAHNFLNPQPVKGAALYFLRYILHDLPDQSAKKLLINLREAATPNTKILAFDTLARHTCKEDSDSGHEAPYPLLANRGIAGGGFMTVMDLANMTSVGGRERTRAEFEELGRAAGWKLEVVKPGKMTAFVYSVA